MLLLNISLTFCFLLLLIIRGEFDCVIVDHYQIQIDWQCEDSYDNCDYRRKNCSSILESLMSDLLLVSYD